MATKKATPAKRAPARKAPPEPPPGEPRVIDRCADCGRPSSGPHHPTCPQAS